MKCFRLGVSGIANLRKPQLVAHLAPLNLTKAMADGKLQEIRDEIKQIDEEIGADVCGDGGGAGRGDGGVASSSDDGQAGGGDGRADDADG